jgi:hypothetical protein
MKGPRIGRLTVATVPVLALLVVAGPIPSAQANHQYCGEAAEGVHLGGYAGETRDNGHPDGEEVGGAVDYAGAGAVGIAKNVAFAADRVTVAIGLSESMYDVLNFSSPNKEVKLGFSIAKLAAGIAKTAADAVVMRLEQQNAEVNACGGTELGDMIDTLFVARIQEELTGLSSGGSPIGPPSMFVLPDDGAPEWTSESDRYDGHEGSLEIPYIDGVANDENIGVAVVVRNAIAHLEAHGINTGGGFKWVPGVGVVYQDGAKDLWWDAIRLLEDGRVRLAYAKFAEAYRMAVSTQTTS